MSPLPHVRRQIVALAALAVLGGILGGGAITGACALAALLWMALLRRRYRVDVGDAEAPPHRARLDRVVLGDGVAALVPALVVCVAALAHPLHPAHWLQVACSALVALSLGATAIYGSSLVDWYLILPRISGQLDYRPCRAGDEDERFRFPETWREVTRWWYIHRVAATVAFRFSLSAAIAFVLVGISGLEIVGKVGAGIVMLTFGAYAVTAIARGTVLSKQVGQSGHVKGTVGQTVTVARPEERRRRFPLWGTLAPLAIAGRHYVVDVALESVQLAPVARREADELPCPLRFERDVDSVPLGDVGAIRQAEEKFVGCRGRCSGINWYCIENPRCFQVK